MRPREKALTRQAWDQRVAQVSREHHNHPDLEETVLELYRIGLVKRWIQDPVILIDHPAPIYKKSNPFPLYTHRLGGSKDF